MHLMAVNNLNRVNVCVTMTNYGDLGGITCEGDLRHSNAVRRLAGTYAVREHRVNVFIDDCRIPQCAHENSTGVQ